MTPHPYWGLGIHLAVSLLLGVGLLAAGALLRYRVRRPATREETYECGEEPFHTAHVRIPVSFYLVALLFILFDLEAAFLFPWVFALHSDGGIPRTFVFWEMVMFLLILFLGWVYALKKGDLAWQR